MCFVIPIPQPVLCLNGSFVNTCVQKRVNLAGLTASYPYKVLLTRLALGWVLGFRRLPTVLRNDKSGSLCLTVYTNHMVYAEYLFSFRESGILVHAGHRLPM